MILKNALGAFCAFSTLALYCSATSTENDDETLTIASPPSIAKRLEERDDDDDSDETTYYSSTTVEWAGSYTTTYSTSVTIAEGEDGLLTTFSL